MATLGEASGMIVATALGDTAAAAGPAQPWELVPLGFPNPAPFESVQQYDQEVRRITEPTVTMLRDMITDVDQRIGDSNNNPAAITNDNETLAVATSCDDNDVAVAQMLAEERVVLDNLCTVIIHLIPMAAMWTFHKYSGRGTMGAFELQLLGDCFRNAWGGAMGALRAGFRVASLGMAAIARRSSATPAVIAAHREVEGLIHGSGEFSVQELQQATAIVVNARKAVGEYANGRGGGGGGGDDPVISSTVKYLKMLAAVLVLATAVGIALSTGPVAAAVTAVAGAVAVGVGMAAF